MPPFRHPEARVRDQFDDLADVVDVLSSFVAIVEHQDSLPDRSLYEVIHEEEHDSEEVEGFADELFALFEGKQVFKGVLHEHACLYFCHEVEECFVVGVDGCMGGVLPSKSL
jgi:hypothetical protein